jgi:hypothetical protein
MLAVNNLKPAFALNMSLMTKKNNVKLISSKHKEIRIFDQNYMLFLSSFDYGKPAN